MEHIAVYGDMGRNVEPDARRVADDHGGGNGVEYAAQSMQCDTEVVEGCIAGELWPQDVAECGAALVVVWAGDEHKEEINGALATPVAVRDGVGLCADKATKGLDVSWHGLCGG